VPRAEAGQRISSYNVVHKIADEGSKTIFSYQPRGTDEIFTVGTEFLRVTAVDDWEQALTDEGDLTPGLVDRIVGLHGDRAQRAIEAVSEHRVKEYRDFVIVVGHQDEYIVEDDACTCKDAEYNLDADDPEQLCWHAIAVRIARALGETDEHDMWYSDVHDFI
jgi:predicted nucleic acid-binding Zn finger protein